MKIVGSLRFTLHRNLLEYDIILVQTGKAQPCEDNIQWCAL